MIAGNIEIVSAGDTRGISELVTACYDVVEPGFQVDRVTTYDELSLVFDAIYAATPDRADKATPYRFCDIVRSRPAIMSSPAHPDLDGHDLAVHLNIENKCNVTLGSSSVAEDILPYDFAQHTVNVRRGMTKPGRLTIFSQGGYAWLPSTVHFFDRPSSDTSTHWIRFSQSRFLRSWRMKSRVEKSMRMIE